MVDFYIIWGIVFFVIFACLHTGIRWVLEEVEYRRNAKEWRKRLESWQDR